MTRTRLAVACFRSLEYGSKLAVGLREATLFLQAALVVQHETVLDPRQHLADGSHPSDQRRVTGKHLHRDVVPERAAALDDPPEDAKSHEVVCALEKILVPAPLQHIVLCPSARQAIDLVIELPGICGLERFFQVAEDAPGLPQGVAPYVMTVIPLASGAVKMPSKRSNMSERIPITFSMSKLKMGSSGTMYWKVGVLAALESPAAALREEATGGERE